jgi:hypothetical protein
MATLTAATAVATTVSDTENRSQLMASSATLQRHCKGSSSAPEIDVALSFVAGSGPRPSAKASSSMRAPRNSPGKA